MILTVEELIKVLRESVNVQQEEAEVIDPAYLAMSDEDLTLFIKLGVSRAYPLCTDLSDLPDGADYPIMLLAKIELYTALAVLKADKVDMGADNNNYLKQDQRFQHYMKLVSAAKEQYDSWLDNEGNGTLTAYDVLLTKEHYSRRNYEKQVKPVVKIVIDSIAADSVEFNWKLSNSSHFGRFKVFISDSPIIDPYKDGATYESKLNEGAKEIISTSNIRNTNHRLTGLKPESIYYLAVVEVERNRVFGYAETVIETLSELDDEEEKSVTDLSQEETGGGE